VRSLAAFVCFFGLTGLYGTTAGWSTLTSLLASLAAGGVMLVAVAWLFSMQKKLYSAGNLVPANAIGRTARVYLKIPAANSGKGKVTVSIQGRTAEYSALTRGAEIATGAEVKIVRQVTEDTFEVEALS
jgi:membrane protein implicated in regulation of membrane protease activity